MPFDADWENKIERIYLAQAPAMSANAESKPAEMSADKNAKPLAPGQKPLTLKGTITVTVGNPQINGWVAKLTSRKDGRRSLYDPKIISQFEQAILMADVETIHLLLMELYAANRDPDSGWADVRVMDYLDVIQTDLMETGIGVGTGLNRFGIDLTISTNAPDRGSLEYITLQVTSQDKPDYANAYTGVRHSGTITSAPVKDIAARVAKIAAERMPEALLRIKPLTRSATDRSFTGRITPSYQ